MFLDVTHQHSDKKRGSTESYPQHFLRGAPAPHLAKMAVARSPTHPWPVL